MQTKRGSFLEALTSTAVGFLVSLAFAPLIFWACGVAMNPSQIGTTTFLFTIVSVIRGYLIRRYFNAKIVKMPAETKDTNVEKSLIGTHQPYYNRGKIEVHKFISDQGLNFNLGSVVKYVCRSGYKDRDKEIEDLEKSINYLRFEIDKIKEDRKNQFIENNQ